MGGKLNPYPSLALGASDLTLKDMVRGYSTFAIGGRQAPPPFLITQDRGPLGPGAGDPRRAPRATRWWTP